MYTKVILVLLITTLYNAEQKNYFSLVLHNF